MNMPAPDRYHGQEEIKEPGADEPQVDESVTTKMSMTLEDSQAYVFNAKFDNDSFSDHLDEFWLIINLKNKD